VKNKTEPAPEAIAVRAESQEQSLQMPAPRHPPGRGSELTPDEIHAVRIDHLSEGLTRTKLAEKYGRDRKTIARYLEGEDFEKLRESVLEESAIEARMVLAAKNLDHARNWNTASDVAALKGDHRPARDALTATGVVQPPREPPSGINAFVAMVINGVEMSVSCRSGVAYTHEQMKRLPMAEQGDSIVQVGGFKSDLKILLEASTPQPSDS
jgi:hypothetical protein